MFIKIEIDSQSAMNIAAAVNLDVKSYELLQTFAAHDNCAPHITTIIKQAGIDLKNWIRFGTNASLLLISNIEDMNR